MCFLYRLCVLTALCSSLPACESKPEAVHSGTAALPAAGAADEAKVSSLSSLAQRFGPIIHGAWVNATYLDMVRRTKSPLLAFDSTGYVSELLIPALQSSDSLTCGVSYGNHEGGDMTIYFRPGLHANSLLTNLRDYASPGSFTELSYQSGNSGTAVCLTTYSKNQKVLKRAFYQRIAGAKLDELETLNYAVNKLLFAGTYDGIDSLNRPV